MAARHLPATHLAALLGSAVDGSPAYQAIADGLRLLIADGRILYGTRLPSERELTAALGVSRTTVARSYAELRDRGYLSSRRGSGSVATLPGGPQPPTSNVLMPSGQDTSFIDLTCAAPAAPPGTAQAYAEALDELPAYLAGSGYYPTGLPVLREALAERFAERGLPTEPDQIIVTTGALAGVAVAARTLAGVADRVLVETPTYPNAIAALRRSGARLVGVPVEPSGPDPEVLDGALRRTRATAALLIPDFHNPTGALMPDRTRARVARSLRDAGTTAIVDETMVELGLGDAGQAAPMATFASTTLTVGTASKSFWGGLRIGWLRAPHDRVGAVTEARLSLDLGAPVLEQLVLVHLLRQREAMLAARRQQLTASRAALAAALTDQLPDWRFALPAGGLALWCELPEPLSSALAAAAERHGVLLASGPRFAVEGGLERFIRLPYTLEPDTLRAAVGAIAVAWSEARRRRSATSRRRPWVA